MPNKTSSPTEKSLFQGFSKLSEHDKKQFLIANGILSHNDFDVLKKEGALSQELASAFIENCIGCFPLPLGVAVNFLIDGQDYCIPMAVEETSVIASCSNIAKWVRTKGALTTCNLNSLCIGQIQIAKVQDYAKLHQLIQKHKVALMNDVNENIMASMRARGGGVKDLSLRALQRPDGEVMAIIHVHIDTCDAMGANIINQVCEYLKTPIEALSGEKVGMCILSNLADNKITQAKVIIKNIDTNLGMRLEEASLFAQLDPYRAATNNKGIMNGIDAVLIATGNDWRAVEAGAHAFAARTGPYSSLTRWFMQGEDLHGILEIPLAVGIVGGVTRLHPVAQICLKMLNVKTSGELARVLAAVGIIQNLAALKALVSDGIVKGHMRLHITNLAMAAGAKPDELERVKQRLEQKFAAQKTISEQDAVAAIQDIRSGAR